MENGAEGRKIKAGEMQRMISGPHDEADLFEVGRVVPDEPRLTRRVRPTHGHLSSGETLFRSTMGTGLDAAGYGQSCYFQTSSTFVPTTTAAIETVFPSVITSSRRSADKR